MVSAEQARDIALFFLLSLLDQKQALQAAHKSIAQLKGMKSDKASPSPSASDITHVLHQTFEAQRKALSRNRPTDMSDVALRFPAGTDFATWQKFHRQASDAEITAVVLTKIIGFTEDDVASGFNVSTGTMKYRVAKGMRQLGAVLSKTETRGSV